MLKSGLFCINEEVIGKIVSRIWSRRILIILEAEVIRKIVMGTWECVGPHILLEDFDFLQKWASADRQSRQEGSGGDL